MRVVGHGKRSAEGEVDRLALRPEAVGAHHALDQAIVHDDVRTSHVAIYTTVHTDTPTHRGRSAPGASRKLERLAVSHRSASSRSFSASPPDG